MVQLGHYHIGATIIKYKVVKQLNNKSLVGPQECKTGWHYTEY